MCDSLLEEENIFCCDFHPSNTTINNCYLDAPSPEPSEKDSAVLSRKVIYIDLIDDWNKPEQTILAASAAGFNVINLAFYLSATGPTDAAVAWQGLSSATKTATMQTVHSAGGVVLVSLGGSTDHPYDQDPTQLGQRVAQWALDQQLDGVDFDLESIQPGFVVSPQLPTAAQLIAWLVTLNEATRAVLGSGRLITHAPQAPYLSVPGSQGTWAGTTGGYTAVFQAGNVDFLNIQYYNQGSGCYQTYDDIFVSPCSSFPSTAISQLSQNGKVMPLSALVVGMPVAPNDASQPFPNASTLHDMFTQANSSLGWTAGVMGWQWHADGSARTWLQTIVSGS